MYKIYSYNKKHTRHNHVNKQGAKTTPAKPIVCFLPTRSAKKPPAKFPKIIATLLTDIKTPIKATVADCVTARDFTRKTTAELDTITLAKVVKKTITNSKRNPETQNPQDPPPHSQSP